MPYFDDGMFHIRFFNKYRSIDDLNLYELYPDCKEGHSVKSFCRPMIEACFLDDDFVFIDFYLSNEQINNYFVYDFKNKVVIR
jgi:hypothetical protein